MPILSSADFIEHPRPSRDNLDAVGYSGKSSPYHTRFFAEFILSEAEGLRMTPGKFKLTEYIVRLLS